MTATDAIDGKPASRRFGGSAALVALGILLSRITGLIRDSVFAYYFGRSAAADAFKYAQKMPNALQNLMGEGVLSASFIPIYARLVAKGDETLAGRVAGVFASFLMLVVSGVVLGGVLLAPFLLTFLAPGFQGEVRNLTIALVRVFFLYVGLLVFSSWCLGVLNTHRLFFLSYVAPVLANVVAIAALFGFGGRLTGRSLAVAVAWGFVAGAAAQFLVQLPFVFRVARQLSFGFDPTLAPVRDMFRNLGPVVLGRGVVQVSGYVDQIIGTLLPTGAVATLAYAQSIYMMPVSLFGMSVAAAELPEMSRQEGSAEEIAVALRTRLARGLRQIAFFVIPTSVAFIVIGRLLVAALYQRGEFTPDATLLVWYVLIGSTIGLLVQTLARLYSSTFYALGDTKTPMRYAIARVTIGAALAVALAFPLRDVFAAAIEGAGFRIPDVTGGTAALGAVGITAASAIAAWVEFLLLRRGIRRRIGEIDVRVGFYARLWFAAGVAGALAALFDVYVARQVAHSLPLATVAEAILVSGVFGVVYFAVAIAVGVSEARATIARFRR